VDESQLYCRVPPKFVLDRRDVLGKIGSLQARRFYFRSAWNILHQVLKIQSHKEALTGHKVLNVFLRSPVGVPTVPWLQIVIEALRDQSFAVDEVEL
jgi:hypothetical protein